MDIAKIQQVYFNNLHLEESKPDKTPLNIATAATIGMIPPAVLLADQFDKKFIMKPHQKDVYATKANNKAAQLAKEFQKLRTKIKSHAPGFIQKFLSKDKLQGKAIRSVVDAAESTAKFITKHTFKIRPALLLAGATAAIGVAVKHLYQSGKIDGSHKALNLIARAENFEELADA